MATFNGTAGNDALAGGAENDVINAYGGNDTVYGGEGRDTVLAGAGDDSVFGGTGNDQLLGGDGADRIDGGAGTDTMWGEAGNDTLIGASDTGDTAYGGAGDDTIILGTADADRAYGGSGNDSITAGAGQDRIWGGADNDSIAGGDGADTLQGGDGADSIAGDAGADTIHGGTGNDTIHGGADADRIYGDSILYVGSNHASTTGASINTTFTNASTFAVDVYWIDNVGNATFYATIPAGSSGSAVTNIGQNAYLTVSGTTTPISVIEIDRAGTIVFTGAADDTLRGGAGNDTIWGEQGNDSIAGDDGDDIVYGGDGNDTVGTYNADSAGNDTFYGGAGNDSLTGGGENDVLHGDAGNDWLSGGVGADTLYGGDGEDIFAITDDHQLDTIFGGEGGIDNDAIAFGNWLSTSGVTVTFTADEAGNYAFVGSGAASGTFSQVEAIWATGYNDTIDAGAANSALTLAGNAGDDSIVGSSANDSISGGDGWDSLSGGAGDDTIAGDAGGDRLYGGAGNDTLFGGQDSDSVFIGLNDGIDAVFGGESTVDYDSLVLTPAGAAVTVIFSANEAGTYAIAGGGSGTFAEIENIEATAQNDLLDASATTGNIALRGHAGNDTILGGGGNDFITGGDGADSLSGGAGNDLLNADAGNDLIYGGAGNDTLDGGIGNDLFYGGDGDDLMYDSDGVDTFFGGAGNDTIYGGNWNDIIRGDAGDDKLYGGSDSDRFLFADGWGSDTVFGGEVNLSTDWLDFSAATAPVVVDFSGNEAGFVWSNQGTVQFSEIEGFVLTAQDDVLDASSTTAAVTADGGAGNDMLTGSSIGNDSLIGGDGDDALSGDAGNDRLDGGAGNDTLSGGSGTDTLTGGAGNDVFVLSAGGGGDIVTDFSLADSDADGRFDDQIDVSGLITSTGEPVTVWNTTVTDDGLGNAKLVFPGGETLVLQGVTPAQMMAPYALFDAGIPCFTTGTLILTPQGEIPIESLRPGDLVCTRDNGPQPLRWMAMRRLGRAELGAAPRLRPVRVAPGALGNDRTLIVSPQHGILLRDPVRGGDEVLVRATHLARMRGGRVRVMQGARTVTYVHLMFDAHQIVWGNGLPSESFFPGPGALGALHPDQRAELAALFPGLAAGAYGPPARTVRRRHDLPADPAALRRAP